MGIYFPNIDNPKCCNECPCIDEGNTGLEPYCPILKTIIYDGNSIHKDCTMIEIKSPHGRLIDADKAATSISMMNNHPCGNSIETVNDVVEWLRFADENGNNIAFPTIIEAEVSE